MVAMWHVGVAASGVITVTFLAVAVLLAKNLTRSHQWRSNPLGAATFFLYLTCGGGHAVHTLQLLDPALGWASAAGAGARFVYGEWHMVAMDVVIALGGIWYWSMRRRFPDLVSGAAVFEDLRQRQRRALEIHDNVVQGVVRAKLALDLGRSGDGDAALSQTLEASRRIVGELLGEPESREVVASR